MYLVETRLVDGPLSFCYVPENRFFPNVSPCGFVRGKREKDGHYRDLRRLDINHPHTGTRVTKGYR